MKTLTFIVLLTLTVPATALVLYECPGSDTIVTHPDDCKPSA